MRWLITGGCGFIGRNLIRTLLARGEGPIRVLDNLSAGRRDDFTSAPAEAGSVELVVGDVRDDAQALRLVTDTDVVVHLAANTGVVPSVADPRHDCLTNVVGTLNYLEACRHNGVRRFVFASSGASVGQCEPPLHEDLPPRPVSPYGASKLAGEAYCSAYKATFGIETVALRFANCYGPFSGHKSSIVARFITEALAGRGWEIYGDGTQTRDFIYVDDVADAIVRSAMTPGIGGEVFHIATSSETTVLDLAQRLEKVLARCGVSPVGVRKASSRVGDVKRNYSDVRKASGRLGWDARIGLDEGLERTVIWFMDHHP